MKKRNPFNAMDILAIAIFLFAGWALVPRPATIENELEIVKEVEGHESELPLDDLDEETARRYSTYKLLYALYAAETNGNFEEQDRLIEKIRAMLKEDPYETLSRFGEVPSLSMGEHSLPHITMPFFKTLDVGTATTMIELLRGNETLYAEMLRYWAHDAVYDDPSKHSDFINWTKGVMDDSLAKGAITEGYLGMLESKNKSEEIVIDLWETLSEIPPTDNKSGAMIYVINGMIENGMNEYIEEEISKLETHKANEEVFLHYSLDYLSLKDPAESMELLSKIGDENYRLSAFIQNGKEWAKRDRLGFANWLAENESAFTNGELRGLNAELKSNGMDPLVELPTLDEDLEAEAEAAAEKAN